MKLYAHSSIYPPINMDNIQCLILVVQCTSGTIINSLMLCKIIVWYYRHTILWYVVGCKNQSYFYYLKCDVLRYKFSTYVMYNIQSKINEIYNIFIFIITNTKHFLVIRSKHTKSIFSIQKFVKTLISS